MTTTTVATVADITRPFVNPSICEAATATTLDSRDVTVYPFAFAHEAPIPIQIIANPAGGPTQPFAVVLRYLASDREVGGQQSVEINGITVGISVFDNGNGQARWRLPDRSLAYLRTRGLDQATITAVVARLSPRDHTTAIPGFDYEPNADDPLGLELVQEHLNTNVSGTAAIFECHVAETGYIYRISALHGDPLFLYLGVIDRSAPLEVSNTGAGVIVINGIADSLAPTTADVVNAEQGIWSQLPAESPPSTESRTTITDPTVDQCPTIPPFDATFLPAGFSNQLLPGSGGQITIGADGSITPIEPPDPNVNHYAGEPGVFIDWFRGDAGHRAAIPEPLTVLGRSAEFGDIEDGFVVNFSVDDGPCGTYAMLAYGVTEADTKSVAAGLALHA
jgi:hypothetical protein